MNQIQSVANSIRNRLCLLEDQVRTGDTREAILRGLEDDIRCVRERAVALAVRHLEPETLGELLADEANATLRNSALTALERQGPYALDFLESVTRSGDTDLAMFAVQALSRIGAPRTIPLLLTLLDHPEENVGLAAIEALGEMHADDAVPRLLESLDGSVWRQFAIIRALGLIGDPRAIEALLSLRSHPMLVEPVVEAIGNIGSDRALNPLAGLLADRSLTGIRDKILVAIHQVLKKNVTARLVLPASSETDGIHAWLREAAGSREAGLAEAAISTILSLRLAEYYPEILKAARHHRDQPWLGECLQRYKAEISAALPEILRTADVQVRCAVLESGTFRNEALPAVVDLLKHTNRRIVRAACVALGNSKARETVPRLIDLFRSSSRELREAAAEALSRMPPSSLGELRADLDPSGESNQIIAALDVVGRAGCEVLSRPVQRLLNDSRGPVRERAMRAIGQMNSALGEELLGLYKDPDPKVAMAAIEASVDLQDKKAIPHLITLSGNPGPVRFRAIQALGRLGDKSTAQSLRECYDSAAMHEKLEIIAALVRLGPTWIIPYLKQVYYKSELDSRRVAAWGMVRTPGALSVEDLAGMASDPDWSIRGIAAEALAAPYGARGQELLIKLARDEEPIVAAIARRSMGDGHPDTSSEPTGSEDLEFKLVSDLIESRFGLVFDLGRTSVLKSQLALRIDDLSLTSFIDYYHFLSYHPDRTPELEDLARQITNGESYFFREHHHFEILSNHILPRHQARSPREPLRVLSAGCSAGQEPYSIAITLHQASTNQDGPGWKVDACDIHPGRLDQARSGRYGEVSLRTCRPADRRLYFQQDGDRFQVRPEYRGKVRFFQANLTDPAAADWSRYNVIFCRNVLIYFSEDAFQEAIDLFARALLPGGYLFLGHSESLINRRDDFEPVSLGGHIVYRKKEAGPSSAYS